MRSSFLAAIVASTLAAAQNTKTSPVDVAAAAATALTRTVTSNVKGKMFDRIAIIWLENTDDAVASEDPNLLALEKLGVKLLNYKAVTHPSEPNYIAASGGDHFGMNDNFFHVPSNVSTIVDLLEDKGISWSTYQEDLPYSGYEGFSWVNKLGANDYVRKHNPFIIYDSIANDKNRLALIKNYTIFEKELAENKLPQYMFFTPNMTNDGHDSPVSFFSAYAKNFITPLLSNKNFMSNTLVVLTFDEVRTGTVQNQVYTMLLGDTIPKNLIGTTDSNYYNHYSLISSCEANWDLDTLGRWDVEANVFGFPKNGANNKRDDGSCDKPRPWVGPPALGSMFFNSSYPGPFHLTLNHTVWPAPNVGLEKCGRKVQDKIVKTWEGKQADTYYLSEGVEIADGAHPPVYKDVAAHKGEDAGKIDEST